METHRIPSTVVRTETARWSGTEATSLDCAAAEFTSVRKMAELAKRIESSAGTSSAWSRFAGQELFKLRNRFGKRLQEVLRELGCNPEGFLEYCQPDGDISDHKDLLLSYRVACLLVAALRESYGQDVARIEVGCVSGSAEFICFIAEKSVGITVQRNDNLFALCTNGGWHIAPNDQRYVFGDLRRTIEKCGGKVDAERPRITGVKVMFSLAV